jgi:hypothetical protein
VDQDHSRKKRVLHEAHIVVDAPFHPTFAPTERITVPKKVRILAAVIMLALSGVMPFSFVDGKIQSSGFA